MWFESSSGKLISITETRVHDEVRSMSTLLQRMENQKVFHGEDDALLNNDCIVEGMLGNEAFIDWSRITLMTYMRLLCKDGQEPKVSSIRHSGGGEHVEVSTMIACMSYSVHQILQAAMKFIQMEDKRKLDSDLFESIFNLVKDL